MTYEDLNILLDYHYWARDRMLDALEAVPPAVLVRDLGSSFKSMHDTAVHIYAAESVWYSRWQQNSPTALLHPDNFPDIRSLRTVWQSLEQDVRAFLRQLGAEGIDRRIDYKLFSGQAGSSPFWQMLQHVVNHATYHRGQLTTMLRQTGSPPPKSMDMITFYRERQSPAR